MAKEREAKRLILANLDEPRAGQYEFSLYKQAHPVSGKPDVIARMKKELAGLRGHRVVMHFNGAHVDAEKETKHFRLKRVFNYRNYNDLFGAGGAYGSAIRYIRDAYSDETLITYSISIEIADEDDEDDEEDY